MVSCRFSEHFASGSIHTYVFNEVSLICCAHAREGYTLFPPGGSQKPGAAKSNQAFPPSRQRRANFLNSKVWGRRSDPISQMQPGGAKRVPPSRERRANFLNSKS